MSWYRVDWPPGPGGPFDRASRMPTMEVREDLPSGTSLLSAPRVGWAQTQAEARALCVARYQADEVEARRRWRAVERLGQEQRPVPWTYTSEVRPALPAKLAELRSRAWRLLLRHIAAAVVPVAALTERQEDDFSSKMAGRFYPISEAVEGPTRTWYRATAIYVDGDSVCVAGVDGSLEDAPDAWGVDVTWVPIDRFWHAAEAAMGDR